MKKIALSMIFPLLIGVLLLPDKSAFALDKVNVTLPSKSFQFIIFPLAKERGYMKEEGIDLNIVVMASTPGLQAVLAGEMDFTGSGSSALVAVTQGNAPLKTVLAVTDQVLRMQKMRQALQRTMAELPESAKAKPEIRAIADMARHRSYNIVHLIYQSKIYEGQSKDYEFGLSAMRAHWQSGLEDIRRTLADPSRLDPPVPELGIVTHDVHRRD